MEIEKLIEKEVPKLDLPNGFEKAPEYKLVNKKKKKKEEQEEKKLEEFEKETYLSKIGHDVLLSLSIMGIVQEKCLLLISEFNPYISFGIRTCKSNPQPIRKIFTNKL